MARFCADEEAWPDEDLQASLFRQRQETVQVFRPREVELTRLRFVPVPGKIDPIVFK